MKKITLFENEEIVHKIRYANKTLILDFLLFTLFTILINFTYSVQYISILTFIFVFTVYLPFIYKIILNLYRRLFQRVYITNLRIIVVNGYFLKMIKIFQISEITSVLYKAKRFDNVNNTSSVKCIFNNNKKYTFKKVKYGIYIAELLSAHIKNKDILPNKKQNKKQRKGK